MEPDPAFIILDVFLVDSFLVLLFVFFHFEIFFDFERILWLKKSIYKVDQYKLQVG